MYENSIKNCNEMTSSQYVSVKYVLHEEPSDNLPNEEQTNVDEYYNYTICYQRDNCIHCCYNNTLDSIYKMTSKTDCTPDFSVDIEISVVDDDDIFIREVKKWIKIGFGYINLLATILAFSFVILNIITDIDKMSKGQQFLWGIGFISSLYLFCYGLIYTVIHSRGGKFSGCLSSNGGGSN